MPGQLDCRVVVVQRRQVIFVLAQQREDEPKVVDHARVRTEGRVPRNDRVCELVCGKRMRHGSVGSGGLVRMEEIGRTDYADRV